MTSPTTIKDANNPDAPPPSGEKAASLPAEAGKESQRQEEIDRLKEENTRLRDQWIRAVAETDNIRKRSQREQEDANRYAITAFAQDMAGVLENLKRASDNIPSGARENDILLNTLGEGVDLTLQQLLAVFEKYGIRRIYPLNQKFDHNLHQAVTQVERDDMPAGMVVEVMQAGYTIGNRLLKPAMVAVSTLGELSKRMNETA